MVDPKAGQTLRMFQVERGIVHRVQRWSAFGQPEYLDPQLSRQSLRRIRRMATVAVKQQGYLPAAVPPADLSKNAWKSWAR